MSHPNALVLVETDLDQCDLYRYHHSCFPHRQVHHLMSLVIPSLVPRPEKRAWYTLSAHAPKCTENPGTSYISVKQSVNYGT